MRKYRKSIAWLLVLTCLLGLVGCSKNKPEPTETGAPTQTTAPAETEAQNPEAGVLEGVTLETAAGLTEVIREDTEAGMVLASANPAGAMEAIRLNKEFDTVYGRYYEVVYNFISNVAGTVRFTSEGAAYYETNEYEVVSGENEIIVRFAAGKNGVASLELGGLDKFQLTFTSITCEELKEDLSAYFLDVAPEKSNGTMEMNADGHLAATYKTEEGWRVKLAVDRALVAGKTYETTFVFTRMGGKEQNVTYTVYDGAATILGSRTYWVENDVCVATFYLTANETITKGTCLELGMLSGGEEASLTVTYIDFEEVDAEKLARILAENPFPGVSAWTEGSLTPAMADQSVEGLHFVNTNAPTDWWKVKLEQELKGEAGKYYRITFVFDSDAEGRIKFVNDGASYLTSNEYNVKKGTNTFTVDFKSGGNGYSCLELGGLGPCELNFTEIKVEGIDKPQQSGSQTPVYRFASFRVWTDGSAQKLTRCDAPSALTLVSANEPTDWWKIKLEKDLSGTAGKCYEVTYKFTSDAAGRIKFVNDDATYFGNNEYDVVAGENTFTVQFKYGGKPYSCLELGGLGKFKLVFTDYTIKEIPEPEVIKNGFEDYKAWTESSMKPLTREDTKNSMILISENEAGDWWKVKLENNFALEPGKTYEAVYTFTSDAEGDIKFGTNEAVTCYTADVYHVTAGENQFKVTFTAQEGAYTCLELGGLGKFRLEFTSITLKETEVPQEPEVPEEPTEPENPEEHTHSFVDGTCSCGETNGFAAYHTWTEGSMNPLTREDTESTMTLISDNAPGDWWKVKLENGFSLEPGKTYEAVYTFTSNAEGDIKFGTNEKVICHTADVYHVTAGENQFKVTFTAQEGAYTCLELGGLGKFRLEFTSITLTQTTAPEQPPEHIHSFVNGMCECGETNGFAGVSVWTEGSLTPVTREDTESTMTMISTNAPGDWWKVKLEWPLAVTEGKTYEATFVFTSDAAGTIKYHVGAAAFLDTQEYNVAVGSNTFKVRFTAGAENYSCLELGGLGAFRLTFTGISLTEVEEVHTHSFVNGRCECGETNGFAGVSVWTEGSLTPVVREDTENSMIMTSTNAPGDWWKVKLEWPLAIEEGKTYEVTFYFTSDVSGTIKYSVNGANYLTFNEYNVQPGSNAFTVRFTAGAENYSCLELGGLGAFKLTFTGLGIQEVS